MDSTFEEIIPPSAVAEMNQLGQNMDMFQMSMKQILGFQNMLYQGLKALSNKFGSLKNEVNFLNNQLLNVDDAVQNYLSRNPVTVYTRDGQHLDDALGDLQDRINSIMARLNKLESNNERFENFMEACVTTDDIQDIRTQIKQNNTISNDHAQAIESLQNSIEKQDLKLDEKWKVIKDFFNKQHVEMDLKLESKIDADQLKYYISNAQLAELIQLFKSLPLSKQVRIVEIIPQVFSETNLTNEEKIQKCFDLLNVERNRVIKEQAQVKMEFGTLKKLAQSFNPDDEDETSPDAFVQAEVRDIGCDSGVTEVGEVTTTLLLRKCKHRTIGTNFDGPGNAECEVQPDQTELMSKVDDLLQDGTGATDSDVSALARRVLIESQTLIENQLGDILNKVGNSMNKGDIIKIIEGLKGMDEMKNDISTLKVKITQKMDRATALQEMDQYVKREEFFAFIETGNYRPRAFTALKQEPVVRSRAVKTVMTPRRKADIKGPLPLVPARNSKMLGVNDKFAIGDDGKTYFRELSETQPTTTRSLKPSYYERSKAAMEQQGIETVLDFQPFVPVGSKEKYEIDQET